MNKTALLILAAGMGSRYGGLKQMDGIGPNGETIIDYSVYDAIQAGFTKVVFVIREHFAEDFKQKISNKFRDSIEVIHVYQTLDTGIEHLPCPADRAKPWGTGHAMLFAKDVIQEPFAVINADDYYGQDAFIQSASFLSGLTDGNLSAMIGYALSNTLSDHGHVNRGICQLDGDHFLQAVFECEKIFKNGELIQYGNEKSGFSELFPTSVVSMNFWLFHPDIFEMLEIQFEKWLKEGLLVPKSEFYIPIGIDALINEKLLQVLVLTSQDSWHGVTYIEDKPAVEKAMLGLHKEELYPAELNF